MKKETTIKDLRQFGVVLGVIFVAIAGIRVLKGHTGMLLWFIVPGMVIAVVGLCVPKLMKPLYILFTHIAHVLGWINTRIILILVYYLILTPIGLIMRIFGKDLLDRKISKDTLSYWVKKDAHIFEKEKLEKQF